MPDGVRDAVRDDPVVGWLGARIYYGWVMVGTALSINAASSVMNPVVFSFMIGPMSDDLGVSKGTLAWAFTLRLAAAGLVGPAMGVHIDRHGARWLGVASGLVVFVSLLALAAARDLWVVYALFLVSGFAGLGGPAGQLLTQVPLAKWFVAQRGKALAIGTVGMAAGTTVMVPITQALLEAVGWRVTTVIFAFVILGIVVTASAIFVRRAPEDLGLHPDGAPNDAPDPDLALSPRMARLTTDEDWTVRQAAGTRAFWLLLGALALAGVSLTGTLVYRVDFWHETGMSPGLVAFGTVIDPLTVVFSAFAIGMLADRVPVRFLGGAGLLGLAASVVPMILTEGETWTIIAHNFVWGVAAGGYITLNNMVWPNYYGRQFLGAIRGVVLPVSIAASGAGAPLFGYLLDSGLETRHVWVVSLVAFAIAATLVLMALPPRRMQEPRAAVAPETESELGVAGAAGTAG